MKKILAILLAVIVILGLVGCGSAAANNNNSTSGWFSNYDHLDTVRGYHRAIIKLANDEVIEVKVKKWCDYEGEQIQITAEDGTVYLTSSFRCDLIRDN